MARAHRLGLFRPFEPMVACQNVLNAIIEPVVPITKADQELDNSSLDELHARLAELQVRVKSRS